VFESELSCYLEISDLCEGMSLHVICFILLGGLVGKSTLLNHLFKTNFREMDTFRGR
jgi:Root hair defective 3 GTP-binding protein (RHD3)